MRKTVEETPDALLDEERPGLVGAERYEGTAGREAYAASGTPESSPLEPKRSKQVT